MEDHPVAAKEGHDEAHVSAQAGHVNLPSGNGAGIPADHFHSTCVP